MGTAYTSAVGAPPVITSRRWFSWYKRLLEYRMAECPLERTTTYYFSQAGNDSTGDGSFATPWKTVDKANTVIAASSGDIRCRFRRVDIWRETSGGLPVGLVVGKANVTIDDYIDTTVATPSTRLPIITGFQATISSGSWSTDATYTNSYKATVTNLSAANSVAWVRQYLNTSADYVYKRMTNEAGVDGAPGSFYYDAAGQLLWIRPFVGDTVPTSAVAAPIEYVREYASLAPAGIAISNVDGVRIHGIRVDGFGCSFNGTYSHPGGIVPTIDGTNACVVSSCESYYGNQHIFIGADTGSAGGFVSWVNCKGGLGYFHQSSPDRHFQDVYFPKFSTVGGAEGICHNCIADGGRLPFVSKNDATNQGAACRVHTSGSAGQHFSLMICYGLRVPASQWQVMSVGNFANPPNWITGDLDTSGAGPDTGVTANDIANCRGFYVNTRFGLRKPTALDATWWVANASPIGCYTFDEALSVRVNGRYECGPMMSGTSSTWMYGSSQPGTHINATFLLAGDLSQAHYNGIPSQSATTDWRWWNCYLYVVSRRRSGSSNSAPLNIGAGIGTANAWANARQVAQMKNCVVHYDSVDTTDKYLVAGLSNNLDSGGSLVAEASAREANNAYIGITHVGATTDFFGVSNVYNKVLNPDCKPDVPPMVGSNIISANWSKIEGYTLQYDANMRRRGTIRAIGPFEPIGDTITFGPQSSTRGRFITSSAL